MARAVVAVVLALALSSTGAAADEPLDGEWLRVPHSQYPISFDLPLDTSVQRVSVFSLARPRRKDRGPVETDQFGLRPLAKRLAAVQVMFFWVTDEYEGVDASELRRAETRIVDGDFAASLLRRVFFQRLDVTTADRGRAFVDGRLAHRFDLSRRVAPGTRDERRIAGEAVLVSIDAGTCLAILARYHEEASPAERRRFFDRVVHSVRIGIVDRGGGIEARAERRPLLQARGSLRYSK